MKSWVEMDAARLAGNFRALEAALVEGSGVKTALLAVVKANAYGHGIAACAPVLAKAGAEWLGVTDAHEGVVVREAVAAAGITRQPRVMVMSGTMALPGEAEAVVRHGLTPVVWELGQMAPLAEAVRAAGGEPVGVHVEIDTGMTRQGVAGGKALAAVLEGIARTREVRLEGVFTHLASTEVAGSEQTREQQERFEAAARQMREAGFEPDWVHVGNTSYIDNGADRGSLAWVREVAGGARSMVRAGLGLYGYLLPIEGADDSVERVRGAVRPVMTWKTRVIAVREVERGAKVGYNGIYVAERPMRLALLPVGYADGLRRELSGSTERSGGWVKVRGERAAIVGRVSMNLTVVDVTEIGGVAVGDEVVLLGDDGITADDHARLAGTIAYEILCGIRTGC